MSTDNVLFKWKACYHATLINFRDAVLRRCFAIRRQYATRAHSNLTEQVPKEERERYPQLVAIEPDGTFSLTDRFERAIADATAAKSADKQ